MSIEKPTKEQRLILIDADWTYSIHMQCQCRFCHNWIGHFEDGWHSPKGGAYHSYCILRSAQVKRLFARQAARRQSEEVGSE